MEKSTNTLEGDGETLIRKATELALAGDISASRLCLKRRMSRRKERSIRFDPGPIPSAPQAANAIHAVFRAMGAREITPREAEGLVEVWVNMIAGSCPSQEAEL